MLNPRCVGHSFKSQHKCWCSTWGNISDKYVKQLLSWSFSRPSSTPRGGGLRTSYTPQWVRRSGARDGSSAFVFDSSLKTISSSWQAQSQKHSGWQTWPVSGNHNTDVQAPAELQLRAANEGFVSRVPSSLLMLRGNCISLFGLCGRNKVPALS